MNNIKSTTQGHLDILDIKNNIVILNNGGACAIIETNAINFELLSLPEQDAAIMSYSALLNSLTFPMQITVRSKKMDISSYLEKVKEIEEKQMNPKIQNQIREYRSFIQDDLVTKEEVLDKSFYVTIPYKVISLSGFDPTTWMDGLMSMAGGKTQNQNKSKVNVDNIVQEALPDLSPKISFLLKEFARMGIKAKQLNTGELIRLFYDLYNSESAQYQKLRGNMSDYSSVLVEPKIN